MKSQLVQNDLSAISHADSVWLVGTADTCTSTPVRTPS
jgi:hypothetical protein